MFKFMILPTIFIEMEGFGCEFLLSLNVNQGFKGFIF